MRSTLAATTMIDLHPIRDADDLHALVIGADGPYTVGPRAGLEHLTLELIAYLWGEDARVVLRSGPPAIT